MNLRISHPTGHLKGTFNLPSSKSESNRALIIQALSQGRCMVENLSDAKDTTTLARLLQENPDEMDVGHAGTAMRFLTAYLAFRPEDKILTGSARMQERPISVLVDALRRMGADIQYLKKEGFPPLAIYGRNARWGEDDIEVPGHVSSQYITALLLIAPTLPDGLRISITGKCGSWPYIEMTIAMMQSLGVTVHRQGNRIEIGRQLYKGGTFHVESDWSAASYGFVAAGLAESADIFLPGLKPESLQGDAAVLRMTECLGIEGSWEKDGLRITKKAVNLPEQAAWDFSNCPDLAQGLMVLLAGLGVQGDFTGLESLRIKETDRVQAMQNELSKVGIALKEVTDGQWLQSGRIHKQPARISTYDDHRMAMAFAPLALKIPGLEIEHPEVVEKSFPGFWDTLSTLGFRMEQD